MFALALYTEGEMAVGNFKVWIVLVVRNFMCSVSCFKVEVSY